MLLIHSVPSTPTYACQLSPVCSSAKTVLQQKRRVRCTTCSSAVYAQLTQDIPVHRSRNLASSRPGQQYDLVLSSGFLAFAYHSGFLQAVEQEGLQVAGVMGTSAGALAGSLYCAGYKPEQVAHELSRVPPFRLLRPSCRPWLGALRLDAVVDRLRDLLPPRFEDLQTEFGVGIVLPDGRHVVVDSGPLPEAVAASAAIPGIFQSVEVPGHGRCIDGGMVDRVGLKAWRQRRSRQGRVPPALVHLISRSSPFSGDDSVEAAGERRVTVVRCPKSGVNFFSLGEFREQFDAAEQRAQSAMRLVSARDKDPLRVVAAATEPLTT